MDMNDSPLLTPQGLETDSLFGALIKTAVDGIMVIDEAGLVQVSMNIEDWQKSGLAEIFRRIEQEAARRGVEVAGSELVGLIPYGAAAEAEQAGLFFAPAQILESRLGSELGEDFDDRLV